MEFHMPSAVFMEQMVKIQVYNAGRFMRRRKLVGSFEIDMATIWKQNGSRNVPHTHCMKQAINSIIDTQ
jgi:hypothetical protein